MSESLFDRVGGEGFFVELVHGFYSRVAVDRLLRPMYPERLPPAERRLRLFLIQYFGGPSTYNEERGDPRLRLRHLDFVIDHAARDAWLGNMLTALEELLERGQWPVSAADNSTLRSYFTETSQFLVNYGGLSLGKQS